MADPRDFDVKETLDITDRQCPMTFVVTKLKLEEMNPGEILEVLINDGDPIRNVPRSLKEQGHKVLAVVPVNGQFKMYVERGQD